MASNPRPSVTLDEYLSLEKTSVERHEYSNGEVFLMAGGTLDHATISMNISSSLATQLADSDCIVRGSDARIRTAPDGLYSYADVVITCGGDEVERDTLLNPCIIVEVLSEATQNYDRGVKFERYRDIAPFREYIVVAQHRHYVEHHVKTGNGWAMTVYTQPGDRFALEAADAVLQLDQIYRKVHFA